MSQYCYFALSSVETPAVDMTSAIGLEPDEAKVRDARQTVPRPVPKRHSWELRCNRAGLAVDEQLAEIATRLEPVKARIRSFMEAHADVEARFQIVRTFNDLEGESELGVIHPLYGRKLGGQHQLLGWRLESELLELMVYLGAHLDADEYG